MAYPVVKPYISVEDYLEGEELSEVRHEYFDGTVRAMARTSVRHNKAAGWLYRKIGDHLSGGPCNAFFADVKLRTKVREKDLFYYPDLMACCDPRDQHPLYREYPKLIVEVLSPPTKTATFSRSFTSPSGSNHWRNM